MFSFNTELQSVLDTAVNRMDWANRLVSALGFERTLEIKYDPEVSSSATAADVWISGTTVYSASFSGDMTFSNGNVTGFGFTTGTTVNEAANLSLGCAVLRISGDGNWMQGRLGLTGSGRDFTISANLNGAFGLGFKSGNHVVGPAELPEDFGEDNDAPYKVIFEDWSSGSAGAREARLFDEPQDPWIWDDADAHADTGAIPYTRMSSAFIHGTGGDAVAVGFHRFRLPPSCNEDDDEEPVWIVGGAFSPYARWATYPAMATYNSATDSTFPKPFKAYMESVDGTLLHTFQQRDSLPINSELMCQTRTSTEALRPHVHIKEMLPWYSHRLKLATKARKYFNGMVPSSVMGAKMAHATDSSNDAIPLSSFGRTQVNGFNHYLALPQWPLDTNASHGNGEDVINDPYLPANIDTYTPNTQNPGDSTYRPTRITGWDYEPGSISGHSWYTGPGGVRFDRFAIPSILAMYLTDPTGARVQGNVPHRTLMDAWNKGMFNHGHHDIRNARTLETIPNEEAAYGGWAYAYGYYTPQGPIFVPGGTSRHIHAQTIGNGANWPTADKDGRRHYNGWMLDELHGYMHPNVSAFMFNDPLLAFSGKLRANAYWMACASNSDAFAGGYLGTRAHAWRYLTLMGMWKTASSHPLSISRTMVEDRWKLELEYFHDNVIGPALDTNHANYNNIYNTCLRNFGMPGQEYITGGNHYAGPIDDEKWLYMGLVLALMKQTGSWTAMRAVSAKCQTVLDFILTCIGKYSVDRLNAGSGRDVAGGTRFSATVPTATPLTIYADWEEAVSTTHPPDGQKDLITNADGSPFLGGDGFSPERNNYQHMLISMPYMLRDFFPERNFPGVTSAVTICDALEATHNARVAAGGAEWRYRYAATGILAAPVA